MNWDAFDNIKKFLEFFVAVSVIFGVWKAWREVNVIWATKHLGQKCQDESMGYFQAYVPFDPLTYIFPFLITKVSVPPIPTLGEIIRAGDQGVFTASIMDNVGVEVDGGPEHLSVTWRTFYERLYQECAWALDREPGKEVTSFRKDFGQRLCLDEYIDKGDFSVWMAKRWAEGKDIPYWKVDTSPYHI